MVHGHLANAEDVPFAFTFRTRSQLSFDTPVCVGTLDVRSTLVIVLDLKLDEGFFLLPHFGQTRTSLLGGRLHIDICRAYVNRKMLCACVGVILRIVSSV
jgi:hypothetical protein